MSLALADLQKRERREKKAALRGLELTAQASSGTGCRCVYVYVCVSGAV